MCLHLDGGDFAAMFCTAFGGTVVLSGLIAAAAYAHDERTSRARWAEVQDGTEPAGPSDGPFRAAGEVPRHLRAAPAALRWHAFAAMAAGLWVVPLVPVALLGAMLNGLGIVLLPLIVAGFQLVGAARGVLLRRFAAVEEVTLAVRLANAVGGVYLGLLALGTALLRGDGALVFGSLALPAALVLLQARAFKRTVAAHRRLLDFPA